MTQPDPIENKNSSVVLCKVMKDLETQAEKGLAHYGTYLKTHNGRDALQDAYEEAQDFTMYLAQLLMERDDQKLLLDELKGLMNKWYGEADPDGENDPYDEETRATYGTLMYCANDLFMLLKKFDSESK